MLSECFDDHGQAILNLRAALCVKTMLAATSLKVELEFGNTRIVVLA